MPIVDVDHGTGGSEKKCLVSMGFIQTTHKNFQGWHHDPVAVEVFEPAGFGGSTIHTMAGMHVNRNGREVYETAAEAVAAPCQCVKLGQDTGRQRFARGWVG